MISLIDCLIDSLIDCVIRLTFRKHIYFTRGNLTRVISVCERSKVQNDPSNPRKKPILQQSKTLLSRISSTKSCIEFSVFFGYGKLLITEAVLRVVL